MEWGLNKTTQKISNKYEQTTEHVKTWMTNDIAHNRALSPCYRIDLFLTCG